MIIRHRLLVAVAATIAGATLTAVPAVAEPRFPAATPSTPITHTIGVGSNPYDVAISQQLGKAFVVLDGAVSVVSLLTHRELNQFSTNGFHGQNAIALVRGETEGYITNYEKNTVAVFDTETHTLKRQITVGAGAVDVTTANTAKGQRAYVAFDNANRLVGIQTSTGKVVQKITIPHGTQTVVSGPGGTTVWAGSSYDGHVYVGSTSTGRVTRTIDVSRSGPVTGIAFNPGSTRAWVAGLGGVSVVSTKTGKTIKFLPILSLFSSERPNMGSIALARGGRYALVENSTFPDVPGKGQVSLIDTKTYKIAAQVTTGIEPESMAVDQRRDVAYVPNYADDTVTYFTVPR